MKATEEKRPFFTVSNLVVALLCFAAFLVLGLAGYYLSAGEFVSARLAAVYALLALVGGTAVLLRLWRFALLYYIGCGLGWASGWFIAGLKGDFAPTAGVICTFFLIGVFSLFGVIAQWRAIRKRMTRRKEEKEKAAAQAEEERKKQELEEARRERERAEAALTAVAAPPQEGLSPEEAAPEKKEPAPQGADET